VGARFLHPQVGSSPGLSTRPAAPRQNAPSPALMLRSSAAPRGPTSSTAETALRCVSKHEGECTCLSSSFETRARAFALAARSCIRAPQDEDGHRVLQTSSSSTQPISFPRRGFAPGLCIFASPSPYRGVAERRETFGCSGTRWTRHDAACQALARRLASHDAGRSPLGAPPWRFWAPGRASLTGICRRIGHSELLAPRS
jgi:hypothetical protein